MDYNRQTIANEIASFKYTMKQTNDDISPAEIIDGLMQWVEQYTNVLHEISVAETLDDLKELNLKSASNLNGNLNCSKELEHYAS